MRITLKRTQGRFGWVLSGFAVALIMAGTGTVRADEPGDKKELKVTADVKPYIKLHLDKTSVALNREAIGSSGYMKSEELSLIVSANTNWDLLVHRGEIRNIATGEPLPAVILAYNPRGAGADLTPIPVAPLQSSIKKGSSADILRFTIESPNIGFSKAGVYETVVIFTALPALSI